MRFEMPLRGFLLVFAGRSPGPVAPGGAREPWQGPGGLRCAPVPVSTEIEMKENFLSHCPSYKSMRERKRERE